MTGMRKGEVSALRWSDIDWDEKKICIQRSVKYVSSRCTEVSNPKTDKSIRTVYISDFLSQLLEQLKRKQIKYLESKGYINEDNYVFLAVRRRHDSWFAGYASMWAAVFADSGVADLCVLNSVRMLYKK